jgi:hypothetical protein
MKARIKHFVISYLVRNLFNSIMPDDVVLKDPTTGHFYVNGKMLTQQEEIFLAQEAQHFANSALWQVLKKNFQMHVNLKLVPKSTSADDILAGKTALWMLQVFQEKLHELSRGTR